MNSLSSSDIKNILSHYKLENQLISINYKDKIELSSTGFYIVNLDSSSTKRNGTHWCVFYFSPRLSLYFDPFGFTPPKEIEKLLNKSSSGWYYSNIQIQDISESSCGYYCIAFIHEKVKNKNSYITFLNKFVNNRIDNEKDLYNILYT